MNRRFVHVVMNNRIAGPCAYTVHSINASSFFYPTRPNRSAAAETVMEDDQLPPSAMNFHFPCSPPAYYGGMDFMSLGRHRNHIVGVDHEGRTILYDTTLRAIRTMPTMTARKGFPISLTVGDSLYVMESRPGRPHHHPFEALIRGHSPSSTGKDWFWRSLPPPPFVHDPGYYNVHPLDDPYRIGAYPRLCACDLLAADQWPAPPPVLQNEWELDLGTPRDWIATGSFLLTLGSGRFCIAKLFENLEEVVSGTGYKYERSERFAVFMGVEVEHGDGDDGAGVQLRMIKHKCKRYSLENSMVDQVH